MTPEKFNKLTPKEKRKLEKLANVVEAGDSAILEHLFEIEERIDEAVAHVDEKVNELKAAVEPNLKDVLEQVKGKDGEPGPKPVAGVDYEIPKDGENYVLTEDDKKEIAKSIKVPIVEKVIERVEVIKEQPILKTEIVKETTVDKTDTPVEIVSKIQSLEGDERLDKSAIKGLREEIDAIKSEINARANNGRGMRKVPIIKKYNLTSQCDGVLKSFVLPPDTTDVIGVFGTQFPVQFDPSNDWTFSGRTLTLGSSVSAPETGQTLWALIEVLFY